jgi:hypothetical protein
VAGEDGLLKTTHDGGNSWTDFATGYHHFYALAYKGNQILAGGTDTDIYFSEDNGSTWNQIFVGNGQNQLYQVGFFADGSGLICGSGGVMIKFENVFLNTPSNQVTTDGFVGFYNATSKTIQIESKLKPIEKVSIFNITGQLIGSFENQSNSFSTDVSNYPSGIYIVTATANGKIQSFKILKQ